MTVCIAHTLRFEGGSGMTISKSSGMDAIAMVNPRAAAIDIGSTMHMAAINPNADDNPVRAFGTFADDLHEMARWFKERDVTSVAMESTGAYWIAAYEVLEQHGMHVILVNARYAKNVPGRKTDVSDAAWLQISTRLAQAVQREAYCGTRRCYAGFKAGTANKAGYSVEHTLRDKSQIEFPLLINFIRCLNRAPWIGSFSIKSDLPPFHR
jgi:hypothetical protein